MTADTKTIIKSYFQTLKREEWRIIPGHEPYEASNLGRIKSPRGNILQPVVWGNRGHIAVRTGGGRGARRYYVHHLILKAFVGPKPDGKIGCHRDDCKTYNVPENLYWGTYKENTADAIRNGKFAGLPKQPSGEDNQNAKYSNEFVAQLRAEYTGKRGDMKKIVEKYNLPFTTAWHILKGDSRRNG